MVFVLFYLGFIIRVSCMSNKPNDGQSRAGYSVAEVSALFGKHRSWGYRQIERGRITASMGFGTAIISAAEVDRITGRGSV